MLLIYFYLVVSHHFLFDFVIFHLVPTVCHYHCRPSIPISPNFRRLFRANSFLSLRFAQDIRQFQPILFQKQLCAFQSISKIKRNYSETNRSIDIPFSIPLARHRNRRRCALCCFFPTHHLHRYLNSISIHRCHRMSPNLNVSYYWRTRCSEIKKPKNNCTNIRRRIEFISTDCESGLFSLNFSH